MARKDIEIRVRTKDDKASRNAKKIADELNRLGTGGASASSGIKKSSEAFSKMAADVGKAADKASGIEKLGTAISKMEKSGEAVSRLSTKLANTTKGFEAVRAETAEYARQSADLRKKIEAEEAAVASRNADLKAAKNALNENKKATLALADAQAVLNGKTRKNTSASGNVASKGVGIEAGAPASSARDSFAAFLTADMAALEGAKSQLDGAVSGIKASVKSTESALDQLNAQLKEVGAKEKEFAEETRLAGNATLKLKADIFDATKKFTGLEEEVRQANTALGANIKTQEDVARAAARATEELDQQQRALDIFNKFANKPLSGGRGTIAQPAEDMKAKAIRDAREELEILRAEQDKLANFKYTDRILETKAAYENLSKAIKLAEENVRKIEIAQRLAETRGQKTGFAYWIRNQESVTRIAAKAQAEASVAAEKEAKELTKVAKQAERGTGAKTRYAAATIRAAEATRLFGNETRTTLSFMQRVRGEVIALTASYIGLFGAYQRIIESANAYRAVERAQQNLGVAFGGDTAKVRQEMSFLNAEADRLGYTFQTLADGYGKISVGAQSAGFSIADTRKLFISIIEAARVSGQSVEQTTGILRAFDQILSKGEIQAEELRGQLGDRMTGAFKLFADALGVTTAELDGMMKAGEVLADRDTLVKVAERLTQVYSGQLPQALASVGFAMDNFGRTIEKINLLMAEGLIDSLKDASKALADFVASEDGSNAFRAIGDAAGTLISVLSQVPQYFGWIATVAKAVIVIKVAQWASQFGAAVFGAVGSVRQLNQAMTTIGPHIVQLSKSQTMFARVLAASNVQINQWERKLHASAQTTVLARARVLALSNGVGFLRVGLRATTLAANAMWAAVGGPVGIAVVAISAIYANWETDADRATAALQGHETVVGRVQEAYGKAQGKVEDWGKAIEGVTKLDAEANLIKLEASYRESFGEIEAIATNLKYFLDRSQSNLPGTKLDPQFEKELRIVQGLVKDLAEGVRPIDEIKQALSDLSETSKIGDIVDLVGSLNEKIGETDEAGSSIYNLSKAIGDARAVLKLFSKDTKEAGENELGLKSAVEDTNTAFDNTAVLEAYTKAVEDLKSKIPSLADDMERLQKTTELNAAAWTALMAAWNSGDYAKIKEVAGLWLRGQADTGLANITDDLKGAGGGGGAAASLLRRFEGLPKDMVPYKDNDGRYRTGYGSDTTTREDGTTEQVTANTISTLADAERDLALRIAEFQNVVKEQIGEDRFNSFDANQQAVLTSLAYNYGELPDRILDAVRTGSASEISSAILELTQDNGGINASRRAQEAAIFNASGDANANVMVEAEQERIKLAQDQAAATAKRIADLDLELAKQDLINKGQEREAEILAAVAAEREANPSISEEELARLREKVGLLYDQQNAQNGIELSEQRVNQLYELRSQLTEQMNMMQANGDTAGAEGLLVEISAVDAKLKEAIQSTIGMWTAIGGAEADVAIAKLRTMDMSLQTAQVKVGGFGLSMDTWYSVFQSAIQGIVGAFESFAQAIANGENAFQAFGQAALQVLAQVLQQIAAAIIQMQILKMLQGFGGGIGQMATAMLGGMAGHTGGVVGSKAIGAGNRVGRPDWMRSALTYHTGGMAGFAPDEVSATLKKGEEILTEEDPRHRNNLGGGSTADKGGRLTQVLAIGEKQVQEMLNQYGGDAVLTHIKSNAPTIRRMLGVS